MNMRWNMGRLSLLRLVLVILLAIAALPVAAQSGPITTQSLFFDGASNTHSGNYLDAQGGLIYNDNVGQIHDGSGDTLLMVGLVGDTKREGAPRLDYHLNSDIAVVKYLSSSFQTQPFGYLDGSLNFKIIPGMFSWTARDSFTQAVLDPLAPATPDNLESLNYITTGPRFTFQPTIRTSIVVDGTYSYIYTSSKSPLYVNIDNHREGADVRIDRGFSNTLTGYIGATYDQVRYTDVTQNTNFNQKAALAGFRFNNARTVLDVQGGYTALQLVKPPRGRTTDTTPSGVTWKLDISRLITPTQRISLHAGKQVTDAANLFRLNVDQPVPSTVSNQIATGQPFTHRDFGATWHVDGVRTTLDVNALTYTDHYELTPTLDHDTKGVNVFASRKINPSIKADLGLSYQRDSYDSGSSLKQFNVFTSVRWRLSQRLSVRFIYTHSTISPYAINQNQIGATVAYNLLGGQAKGQGEEPELQPTSPIMQRRL